MIASVAVCVVAAGGWYAAALRHGDTVAAFEYPFDLGARVWFNVPRALSYADLSGRPVLYEFWATWCPSCIESIPKLNGVQNRYRAKGLLVIGVTAELAKTVASSVTRFGIRYPTCAEANASGGGTLPYAVLVSPAGQIVWEGDARWCYVPLHRMMEAISGQRYPDLIVDGNVVGFDLDRPSFARGYDVANLRVKLNALLPNVTEATEAQLQEVFDFYWKNLPHNGWKGDSGTLSSASDALVEIYVAAGKDRSSNVGRMLQRELLKRLELENSNWSDRAKAASLVPLLFPEGDARMISVLKRLLASERNPITRLSLAKTMEKMDPETPKTIHLPSPLQAARQAYTKAAKSLSTRIFGLPTGLLPYKDYETSLRQTLSTEITEDTIRRMAKDYRIHHGDGPSDLLIRANILRSMSHLPHLFRLPGNVAKALQRAVFEILGRSEDDWMLRMEIVRAQSSVGINFLDPQVVVDRVDAMLLSESVRSVRADLEYLRLMATDPGTLE